MKKYILLVFGLLLLAPTSVFASIIFSLPSPQEWQTLVHITCDVGTRLEVWNTNDTNNASLVCADGENYTGVNNGLTDPPPVTYRFTECDENIPLTTCSNNTTITDALADSGLISQRTFTFSAPITPTLGLQIFGGTAPSIGTPIDGGDFVNMLTANVQDTMSNSGLGGITAVVSGLILAFIILRLIIGLFSETGKADLARYHHSDKELESKGIDGTKINYYKE